LVVTVTDAVTVCGEVEVAVPRVPGLILQPTPSAAGFSMPLIPVPAIDSQPRPVSVTPAGRTKVMLPELLVVAPELSESALLPIDAPLTVTGNVTVRTMLVVGSAAVTVKVYVPGMTLVPVASIVMLSDCCAPPDTMGSGDTTGAHLGAPVVGETQVSVTPLLLLNPEVETGDTIGCDCENGSVALVNPCVMTNPSEPVTFATIW
jgi:hypothetical protein